MNTRPVAKRTPLFQIWEAPVADEQTMITRSTTVVDPNAAAAAANNDTCMETDLASSACLNSSIDDVNVDAKDATLLDVLHKDDLEEEQDGMMSDDDEDDSVHDTLRTCIEEGYLDGDILTTPSKRKRDTFGLAKKRKSKRQRDKKRKMEREAMKERDLAELRSRKTLTNQMEEYFEAQYGSKTRNNTISSQYTSFISSGNDEKGYLGDLLLAAFELDSRFDIPSSAANDNIPESSKKRRVSSKGTPTKRDWSRKDQRIDIDEREASDDEHENDYRTLVVDIDDYMQQQSEVIGKQEIPKKSQHYFEELSSSSPLEASGVNGRKSTISVSVVVRGKKLSDHKVGFTVQRRNDKPLLSSKKTKVISGKRSPQNKETKTKTSISPVNLFEKKRSRVEKVSSSIFEKPDLKEVKDTTHMQHRQDNLSDDEMYSEYVGAESSCILDWKRQVQWSTSSDTIESKARRRLVFNRDLQVHYASSIEATQLLYQRHIPKQPSSLEVPRHRHKDSTYARWCNQLLNCLSSSGRNMALHEWFYCDVDRGWFSRSTFSDQVEKVTGLSKDIKLSCCEWSIIRQMIAQQHSKRNKQRKRFSKRFISSQLNELDEFRNQVRNIQFWGYDALQLSPLKYDISGAIPVGATVTAFNKSARLLHRGLILDRDYFKGILRYRVQFERKELGWEYCADIDVASHGPPNIMLAADCNILDGSLRDTFHQPGKYPYGTSYGPLIESHKEMNQKAIEKLKENLGRLSKKFQFASDSELDAEIATQRIERDALTKLMEIYESLLKRKQLVLDSIKAFHDSFVSSPTSVHPNDEIELLESYQEHHEWLLSNMQEINSSIGTVLLHMRAMYGNAYAQRYSRSGPSLIKVEQKQNSPLVINQSTLLTHDSLNDIAIATIDAVVQNSKISSQSLDTNQYANENVNKFLYASTNLMLSTEICDYLAENQSMNYDNKLSLNMASSLLNLSMMGMRSSVCKNIIENTELGVAMNELAHAVDMLSQELACY